MLGKRWVGRIGHKLWLMVSTGVLLLSLTSAHGVPALAGGLVPVSGSLGAISVSAAHGRLPGVLPLQRFGGELSCARGDYYTISNDDGTVSKFTSVNGKPNARAVKAFVFSDSEKDKEFNGLGIGANGAVAYAFNRRAGSSHDKVALYRWTPERQTETLFRDYLPASLKVERKNLVAGGIEPLRADANFYFGGFYRENRREGRQIVYFELLTFENSKVRSVGYIRVTELDNDDHHDNGDIVFNAAGDMFLLWSNGHKDIKIVSVQREEIEKALKERNSREIPVAGKVPNLKVDRADRFNGAAFDEDGNLFLQYSDAGATNTGGYSIDPDNGKNNSDAQEMYPVGKNVGTDLASCASPSTLFLVKDVKARAKPGDQFKISVKGKDEVLLAEDETSTENTGALAYAGIFVVKKGREYILAEGPANGATRMSDYDSSLSCVDSYTGKELPLHKKLGRDDDHPTYGLNIAAGSANDITCTFVNSPKSKDGTVRWVKTAAETGDRLPGSAWRIIPEAPGGKIVEVTDNAGQQGYNGSDKNTAVGDFEVTGLPLGNYTLHEVSAPEGYTPAKKDTTFQIEERHATTPLDLKAIPNRRIKGVITWEKVDEDAKVLPGSIWTFTPTRPTGKAKNVTDCKTIPCSPGGDQDSRAGYFRLTEVPYGTYSLVEESAPQGYVKSDEARTVTVKDDGETVAIGSVTNQRLPEVSWTKVKETENGDIIGGSVWIWKQTTPAQGEMEVADCVQDSADKCLGADKDPAGGKFLLKSVALGEYVLTEKTPPSGYVRDDTPHGVKVESKDIGKTIKAGRFVNRAGTGSVSWSKIDGDNGELLGGSVWSLSSPGRSTVPAQLVADCVKDSVSQCLGLDRDPLPGRFKVENLAWGDYVLVEQASPAGFRLDSSTEHKFRLGKDHIEHAFAESFKNYKVTVPVLPLTGGTGAEVFLFGGCLLGALALLFARLRRRRL
ncbi:Predicted outer membrane protein [Actinomyces bovis]|uniref:Predicted outer membrane protein n=1 Tax=Actinomyces bovis TaxID=1658 RepID=A0ABY1VR42_9ACTO|nr:SpaA isopeptide-forming pilin-related protein [Actinomyces bovis]SPT53892.1 Predicted outer membrane protein [Actinomyces bovis]VEG53330.1 Predicted outer membrane protein [Actinomyces israelii]